MCGAQDGDPDEYHPGREVRLHVSRIISQSQGGAYDPSNLRVLCSMCYMGVRQLAPEPRSQGSILDILRQADHADQLKALEWLKEKHLGIL